jgi:hypothetical protein
MFPANRAPGNLPMHAALDTGGLSNRLITAGGARYFAPAAGAAAVVVTMIWTAL